MLERKGQIAPTRRRFLGLAVGLAAGLALSGCFFKPRPIRIALHVWPGYEPIPLARALGRLDEPLVKLIETTSASESMALLAQGKADAAGLTLDEVLRAREHGVPLSVVLVCDISAGADVVMAQPNITALSDIKGCRIGVESTAVGALMLYKVLEAAGLTKEDVVIVPLTVDRHFDAWQQRDIDVVVTYEPAARRILDYGGRKLFDSRQIPNTIIDVLAVRSEVADYSHAEALRHLTAAHLDALRHINVSSDDSAYRLAPRFHLPPDEVLSAFRGLVLPDLENNIRLLGTSNPGLLTSARLIGDTLYQAGILHKPAKLDNLLKPEYLPRNRI